MADNILEKIKERKLKRKQYKIVPYKKTEKVGNKVKTNFNLNEVDQQILKLLLVDIFKIILKRNNGIKTAIKIVNTTQALRTAKVHEISIGLTIQRKKKSELEDETEEDDDDYFRFPEDEDDENDEDEEEDLQKMLQRMMKEVQD